MRLAVKWAESCWTLKLKCFQWNFLVNTLVDTDFSSDSICRKSLSNPLTRSASTSSSGQQDKAEEEEEDEEKEGEEREEEVEEEKDEEWEVEEEEGDDEEEEGDDEEEEEERDKEDRLSHAKGNCKISHLNNFK